MLTTCTNCNLKQGSIGDDVKTDQRRLKYLGHYTGKIDGDYGPYTVSAVKAYQKDVGLVVDGWTGSLTCNYLLLPFITPSKNCQSDNATIMSKAAALGNANQIFNWVRDVTSYSWYNNTKLGALGEYNKKVGNCCDMSHLIVALARALGIPARYRHVLAKFSSGSFGHVVAQLFVNGSWLTADATYNYNQLGVVKNWSFVKEYGVYRELPF